MKPRFGQRTHSEWTLHSRFCAIEILHGEELLISQSSILVGAKQGARLSLDVGVSPQRLDALAPRTASVATWMD